MIILIININIWMCVVMYFFDRYIVEFLDLFDSFISRTYVIDDIHFTRERKMVQKEYTAYILTQRGCNDYIESIRFFTRMLSDGFKTISPQAIGKQRMYLDYQVFVDMYESFIDGLYHRFSGFSKYKGYIVCACDGSIFDLPNVTLTREEFPDDDEDLLKPKRIRARVSCFLDVNSHHILTSRIVERNISEIDLAIMHLDNLKERFDIKNFISVYDRGYASIRLMLKLMDLNSKFLIRLPKNVFKHQISKMISNDEIIEVNLTKGRLKKVIEPELKELAENIGSLKIRIVLVDIGNDELEILATNLTRDEFSIDELKELYGQRWSIETGFDKLKNIVDIEAFSGHRRRIIEQDFYAHIFLYNLATTIQIDGYKRIKRKPRNPKDKITYKPTFTKIIGNIYLFYYEILFGSIKEKTETIKFLIKEASRILTQEKEDENKNKERKEPDSSNDHPGNKKKAY